MTVQQVIRPATEVAKPAKSGKTKWIIIGGIAILLLFILLIVVVLAAFWYLSQYR